VTILRIFNIRETWTDFVCLDIISSRQTGDASLVFAVGIDSSSNKLFLTITVSLKRVSVLLILNIILLYEMYLIWAYFCFHGDGNRYKFREDAYCQIYPT
jgi:hypothetical protein